MLALSSKSQREREMDEENGPGLPLETDLI